MNRLHSQVKRQARVQAGPPREHWETTRGKGRPQARAPGARTALPACPSGPSPAGTGGRITQQGPQNASHQTALPRPGVHPDRAARHSCRSGFHVLKYLLMQQGTK